MYSHTISAFTSFSCSLNFLLKIWKVKLCKNFQKQCRACFKWRSLSNDCVSREKRANFCVRVEHSTLVWRGERTSFISADQILFSLFHLSPFCFWSPDDNWTPLRKIQRKIILLQIYTWQTVTRMLNFKYGVIFRGTPHLTSQRCNNCCDFTTTWRLIFFTFFSGFFSWGLKPARRGAVYLLIKMELLLLYCPPPINTITILDPINVFLLLSLSP